MMDKAVEKQISVGFLDPYLFTSTNISQRSEQVGKAISNAMMNNYYVVVNTKNWYRKETDLWAEFNKETPFGRKFTSKDSVKMPAVGSAPSYGRRVVLHLEKETFGNM
jgi:hypothetical protein